MEGYKVNFTDLSTDNQGIKNWSWSFGDSTSSIKANASHRYSEAGSYTVSLTVYDEFNWSDTVDKVVDVEVNDPVSITFIDPDNRTGRYEVWSVHRG